jgi:hypothetical protein
LRPDCCARRILSLQKDFQEQKGKMQEAVEGKGHLVAFYPKFHCEINWIEYYWGGAKRYARDNCEYNLEALRHIVPEALSSVPSRTITAFHACCQRRMEAYRLGLKYGMEEFKNYPSHRRVRTEEDDI